jgi:hypothetical protein
MGLPTILTAGVPGDRLEVTDDEVDALAAAIGQMVGLAAEYPLVSLLRKLAPAHPVLVAMDRISREHGYVAAGTDERLATQTAG